MAPLPDAMTYAQWSTVYNALSFGIAGMGIATIFFWLQLRNVSKNYQTAVIITGSVTCIATYHYLRMFNSWVDAFVVKSPSPGANYEVTLSGTPFNDAYRYVDWLLTVPLLLIELVLVMKLPKAETTKLSWQLGVASAMMIALGYPGEIQDDLTQRWFWWALAMLPFCFVVGTLLSGLDAATAKQPAAMEQRGLVGNWVQQNHDRLAQKAGFPQRKLNEIHGAWGDMKNQVKMMDDTLRRDLLEWLVGWADRAKMCVAIGTSLCGMNADQVPGAVADRFLQSSGEGLVIIGLQRTAYDNVASLRIWGLCDEVMRLLARELGCKVPDPKVIKRGEDWVHKHPRLSYNTPTRSARDPL
jgi:hypothetical protein